MNEAFDTYILPKREPYGLFVLLVQLDFTLDEVLFSYDLLNYNVNASYNNFLTIFSLKDIKYVFLHHTAHHIPMQIILITMSRIARVNTSLFKSNCMSPYWISEPTAIKRITCFK